MKHLEIVDFLKGYAIFSIVLFHLMLGQMSGLLGTAINFGGAGVHVFVLCSWFGLYLSHMRKKMSYGSFMKRRILRVHLPFVIVVIASCLLPWAKFDLQTFLSNIFFYKMFSEEWDCALIRMVSCTSAYLWYCVPFYAKRTRFFNYSIISKLYYSNVISWNRHQTL